MTKRSSLTIRCAAVFAALSAFTSQGYSQVLYGSLTGNVTDPSSAVVPGAKVEALNTGTGNARQTMSDDHGIYLFSDLPLGVYKVTLTAPSFRTVIEDNVRVDANTVRRADFHLQIAQTSDMIEISAASTVLQTDRADVHEDIGQQQVEQLPYNGGQGRNFQSLYILIPGAAPPSETNSDAGNPQRAQQLYMNGVSSTTTSTKLDGATISYPWLPRLIAYVPPSDAVEQVNIVTNAFDAEQGSAGGAAINVSIKSGTNQLHGTMFEYHQDNAMLAKNYFVHSPLSKNILNQFGFTLGGPVWIPKIYNGKNKLFFFVDWQRTMRRQYAAQPNMTIATPAMRTGDFNGLGVTIYDPLTGDATGHNRTPFANNVIPSNRIDPAAATMGSLLPTPLRPGLGNNYDAYGSYQFDRDSVDVKTTYNPDDKSQISGRYSISPMTILAPQELGKAGGDAFGGGQPGVAGGRIQSTSILATRIFSPAFIVDGNLGYTRQVISATGDPQNGAFGLDVLKIPGTNGVGPQYAGIPAFFITGLSNLGNPGTGSPFLFRDNQYTTGINVTKIKSAHSLRFGFEYDHFGLNHFQPQGGTTTTARGAFTFNGTLTALNGGAPPTSANSWADFLLGFPSSFGKVTQFVNPNSLRFSSWAFYARDQWQVNQNLTLTYGLRWEHYPILAHDWYGAVRFDPATDKVLVGCFGGVPCDTGASAGWKNFAPRIGLAYRLGEKTVIRTGYGISIDPDNMRNQRNDFPSSIIQNFNQPNQYSFVSTPGAAQASLRTGIPAAVLPDITQGVLTPSSTISTGTFPKDFNRGYVQSWNFIIQRAITSTMTAEAGYVGTHAVRTIAAVNINAALPGGGNAGRALYATTGITTDLNSYAPFGSQKYNALQTKFTKRFRSNQVGVRYTFSKNLNTNDDGDAALLRNLPASWSLNKGLASFDRTHNFQLFHVYDLPFGKGQRWINHGFLSYVIGGWQTSGILSRYSGTPFTVSTAANALNAPGQSQTADQLKPNVAILGGHDPNTPYFDPYAFGPVNQARFGTSGRDIVRGPGTFNMGLSLSRIYAIRERVKLQLRGEAFNATNTPQFNNPGATVTSATFNADGTIRNYGGYSTITSASNPRQIQVAARISF